MKTLSHRILAVTLLLCACAGAMSATASAQARMRPPAPKVTFPEGIDTVEIPFEMEGHIIIFPVRVNGAETLRFALDSGASSAVLRDAAWVEKLGLPVLGEARVAGAGSGSAGTATLTGPITFDIGGVEVTHGMVAAGVGGSLKGMSWDGVIGAGLLGQSVAEIDYENRVLRLYRSESFEMPMDAEVIDTHLQTSGIAAVPAEVEIDGEARQRWLALDIGAFHAVSLNAEGPDGVTLPTRRIPEQTTLGWGTQGTLPGYVGVIDSLRMGDLELQDLVTTFPGPEGLRGIRRTGEGDIQVTGNLGTGILRGYTVIIDHPHSRLGLRPRATPFRPFNFSSSGIVALPAATNEGLVIHEILPGTPADEAGLAPGDIVTSVGDSSLAGAGIGLRGTLLDPPPGTQLDLEVKRAGTLLEIQLVTRALFGPS